MKDIYTKFDLMRMNRDELLQAAKKLNKSGVYKYDSLINWLLMGLS